MVSPSQSRAARGLIDWSQSDLATAADVSLGTVQNFEAGKRVPIANNLMPLQRTLEAAGVEFMNGDQQGVRLRPPGWASESGNSLEPIREV